MGVDGTGEQGVQNEGVEGQALQKVTVGGIDAGISHCWEGLELLVLGGGRMCKSLALPCWAPVYPAARCTLEGLRRGAWAQPSE